MAQFRICVFILDVLVPFVPRHPSMIWIAIMSFPIWFGGLICVLVFAFLLDRVLSH